MNTVTIANLVVLLSVPWWGLFLIRLTHVARHGHLTHMPRFYLWLTLYGIGLLYYLYQYELEQQLQSWLVFTHLPIISILKVLISCGLVTYGYIVVVRRYTRLTVPRTIDPVMIGLIGLAILVNLVLYERIPYLKLQLVTNVLVSCANLFAAVAILPMLRQLGKSRQNPMREAHQLWHMLQLLACGCAASLLLVDAVYKLIADWNIIYSPLFVMASLSQTIAMMTAAVLVGPDRFLNWIYYPRRLITYVKLKRLADYIQHQTHRRPTYNIPVPRIPTLSALEFVNYKRFIFIMDNYRYLPKGSRLSFELETIDHQNALYKETLQQLETLI